jgi:hypothetical protein
MSDPLQTFFVVGAPGGGTSAVTGVLSHLGIPVPGPYERNDDPRTPATYESRRFTKILRSAVDESSLAYTSEYPDGLLHRLRELRMDLERGRIVLWHRGEPRRVAFKRPIAALCLRELIAVFEPTVILVHRAPQDVERTRQRRNWPSALGSERPPKILNAALTALVECGWPFLGLSYSELVQQPEIAVRRIVAFGGLSDLEKNVARAVASVRRSA